MIDRRKALLGTGSGIFASLLLRSELSAARVITPPDGGSRIAGIVPKAGVVIPGTDSFDLRSPVSGVDYRISVSLSSSAANPRTGRYSVVYLLDGQAFFNLFTGVARALADAGECPPLLIVGIAYPSPDAADTITARMRDFTPVADELHEALVAQIVGPGHPVRTGGADDFLRFIEEALKPEIAARYPADPADAMLAGHSLGGLFALHALFACPRGFRRYAVSSPPILWADEALMKAEADYARDHRDLPARLFLAAGGEETDLGHVLGLPDTFQDIERTFVAAVGNPDPLLQLRRFHAALAARHFPGLALDLTIFPNESHTSVAAVAFGRALRTLFSPR